MKILAFNGGNRSEKVSKTTLLLRAFLEGCEKAGAEVEEIALSKLDIKTCKGCFSCWTKSPGVCVHKDDAAAILQKMQNVDVEVWATPLFHFGVHSLLKTFMERTLPLSQPFLIEGPGGRTAHPYRYGPPKARVVLSVCGFPEIEAFEAVTLQFQLWTKAACPLFFLYRPGAEMISHAQNHPLVKEVLMACQEAGQQLVQKGSIDDLLLRIIAQDLMPKKEFNQMANLYWKSLLDLRQSPVADLEKGKKTMPMPQNMKDLVLLMKSALKTQEVAGKSFCLGFVHQDDPNDRAYLVVESGKIHIEEKRIRQEDLMIQTLPNQWYQVMSGEISGQNAFQKGLYQAQGDMALLLNMNKYFGSAS